MMDSTEQPAGEGALAGPKRTRCHQDADSTANDAGEALLAAQPSPKRHQRMTDDNASNHLPHPGPGVLQGCARWIEHRRDEVTTHVHNYINAGAADPSAAECSLIPPREAQVRKSVRVNTQQHQNDSPQSSEDCVVSQLPVNHPLATPQLDSKMTVGQACELPSLHLKVALRTWAKVRCPTKSKELGDAMLVSDLLSDFDCYVAYLQQAVGHGLKPITARKYAQELRLFLKQHQQVLSVSSRVDYHKMLEQLSATVAAFRSLERERKQQQLRAGQSVLPRKRSGAVKRTKLAAAALQHNVSSDPGFAKEAAAGAPAEEDPTLVCDGSALQQQHVYPSQDWQFAACSMSMLTSCAMPRGTGVQHDVFMSPAHSQIPAGDHAYGSQTAGEALLLGRHPQWKGAEQQACVRQVSAHPGNASSGAHAWNQAEDQQTAAPVGHPQHVKAGPQCGALPTPTQHAGQDHTALWCPAADGSAVLASAAARKRLGPSAQQAAATTCQQLPPSGAAAAAAPNSLLLDCKDTAAMCSVLIDAVAQSLATSSAYVKLLRTSTTSNSSPGSSKHEALASLPAGHPAQGSLQAAVAAAAASAVMGVHTLSIITGTAGHVGDVLSQVARSCSDSSHVVAQLLSACLTQHEHSSSHSALATAAHAAPVTGALNSLIDVMPPFGAPPPSSQADVAGNQGPARGLSAQPDWQGTKQQTMQQQWPPPDENELFKLPQLHQELGSVHHMDQGQRSTSGHAQVPSGSTYLPADQHCQQPLQQQWCLEERQQRVPAQASQQKQPQHEQGPSPRTVPDTQRSFQGHHQPTQDQALDKWQRLTASAGALGVTAATVTKLIHLLTANTSGGSLSDPPAGANPAGQTAQAARGVSSTAPSDSAAEVQTSLCEAAVPFAADSTGRRNDSHMASSFADVLLSAASHVGRAEQRARLQQDAQRSATDLQLAQASKGSNQKQVHEEAGDYTGQEHVPSGSHSHAQETCLAQQQAWPAVAAFAEASLPVLNPVAAVSGGQDAAAAANAGRHDVWDVTTEAGSPAADADDHWRLQECLQEVQQIRQVLFMRGKANK